MVNKMSNKKNISRLTDGYDIIVTKYIAISGTLKILQAKRQEIKKIFPGKLFSNLNDFNKLLNNEKEIEIAKGFSHTFIYPLGEKGINKTIWDIASTNHIGIFIEINKIPIKLETVEITDYYSINPYELESIGATLIATKNSRLMMKKLNENSIDSCIIGKTTREKKVMIYGDNVKRTLKPPKNDSIVNLT